MSRFRVALFVLIALVVFTVAVLLYLQNWRFGKLPPANAVHPCRWDPALFSPSENTCYKRCGPPNTPDDSPVQATINGKTYLFCCPRGYTARFENNDVVCVRN